MNDEFYIVVDIEAAGPNPGMYSLLSIGATTLDGQRFYVELVPDHENYIEEAMEVNQLSFDELLKTGVLPKQAMQQFSSWISEVYQGENTPVFTAFNAPFDWMFINDYFHKYLNYNPFGHKALDIKALYMGLEKTTFGETSHKYVSAALNMQTKLSHHALQDAIDEAELFKLLLEKINKKT